MTTDHDHGGRLSSLDVAFLALEQTAPMHLGAVLILTAAPGQEPPSATGIAELLAARAARTPQLRQRITHTWSPLGGATWTEDPRFDVHTHVHTHSLPVGSGWDVVSAWTAQMMRRPLELDRPPWALHVLGGLDGDADDGRVMVLVALHHALCDGAGAIRLGVSLLDPALSSGTSSGEDVPVAAGAGSSPAPLPVGSGWPRPGRLVTTALSAAAEVVREPAGSARRARARLDTAAGVAASVLRQLRLPTPRSPLSAPVTRLSPPLPRTAPFPALIPPPLPRARRVRMIRLDEQDIRAVRRRHGGTSHDVLLTALTGAVRAWLASRGEPVETARVRALIPVNQRPRLRGAGGGNQVSGYLCDLPVHNPDPQARLTAVRAAMQANKAAGPHRGAGALAALAQTMPPALHRALTPLAAPYAGLLFDLVITTVRLPATAPAIGGALVAEVYPLVPLTPGHALGVALCHHQGAVHIGLHADAEAVPDLDKLAEAITAAVAELTDTLTMGEHMPGSGPSGAGH